MKIKFFPTFFLAIIFVIYSAAPARSGGGGAKPVLQLDTYYPSPFGVYKGLATGTLGVGDKSDPPNGIGSDDVPADDGDVWIAGDVRFGGKENRNKTIYVDEDLPQQYQRHLWIRAGGETACFSADTRITTPSGYKRIKNLANGDLISSYDIEERTIKQVAIDNIYSEAADGYYVLKIANKTIKVTSEHRFYTPQGWKTVKDLNLGDEVFDGKDWLPLVSKESVNKKIKVYNIHMGPPHTFFAEGILVHNIKPTSPGLGNLYLEGGRDGSLPVDYGNILLFPFATNGGNVGIGTETPRGRLDVKGKNDTEDKVIFVHGNTDTSTLKVGIAGKGLDWGNKPLFPEADLHLYNHGSAGTNTTLKLEATYKGAVPNGARNSIWTISANTLGGTLTIANAQKDGIILQEGASPTSPVRIGIGPTLILKGKYEHKMDVSAEAGIIPLSVLQDAPRDDFPSLIDLYTQDGLFGSIGCGPNNLFAIDAKEDNNVGLQIKNTTYLFIQGTSGGGRLGYVGIGTEVPGSKLEVADGDITVSDGNIVISKKRAKILMKSDDDKCWMCGPKDNPPDNWGCKKINCVSP